MGLRKIEEVKSEAHIDFLEEELRVGESTNRKFWGVPS